MKLTSGKRAGLEAVSNKQGIIAAVAMDQRGSLKKALGPLAGNAELTRFKVAVSEILTPHASSILLDPEFGLPAAAARDNNSGLLLAYEKTGYDKTAPGRLPDLLDHWSVRRLKEAGADCIKLLLYYSVLDPEEINHRKHAWVERVGDECRANDIPLFLELLVYQENADEKSVAFAKTKPSLVKGALAEFSQERYSVDVFKVEIPVNMKCVEGTQSFTGQRACSREDAKALLRDTAQAAKKPFIYLSAGVSNSEFNESLLLAAEAGVRFSGVLCGRATWKNGIPIYAEKGESAFREWLSSEGVRNIENLNASLASATPWQSFYSE